MELKATKTFEDINNCKERYCLLQGGSRSGKTYAICQWLIVKMLTSEVTIRAFRKYSSTHYTTDLMTFKEVIRDYSVPFEVFAGSVFTIGRSTISFLGADGQQKLQGGASDISWCNEANELTREDFDQIDMRTTDRLIMDFNPKMRSHWLYTMVPLQPTKAKMFYSTFRDNPFLGESQIEVIVGYRTSNPTMWRIYGKGEKATAEESVYPLYNLFHEWPERAKVRIFGLDFGMVDPTALVEVSVADNILYVKEHLFRSNLTTNVLAETIRGIVGSNIVYCDAAEPDRIRELQLQGFNATKAIKSVQAGISYVSGKEINIWSESKNLIREINGYSWQRHKGTGELLDKVVDGNDHLLDAMRYAVYSHWGQPKQATQFHNLEPTYYGKQEDTSFIGYKPDF